ncbi:MAG: hypothetical protein ABMA26_20535, partial [Limisphaerales bacterium]
NPALQAEIEAFRKGALEQFKDRKPDNFEDNVRDTATRNFYQRQFTAAMSMTRSGTDSHSNFRAIYALSQVSSFHAPALRHSQHFFAWSFNRLLCRGVECRRPGAEPSHQAELAIHLGFAAGRRGGGEEEPVGGGEARDFQESVHGHRGRLLHLPAAGL